MSTRLPRKVHTNTEWEDIKPTFVKLYIEEDLKLADVIERLHREHGFLATLQMFKKRIRLWGIAKYMKAHQKEITLHALLTTEDLRETAEVHRKVLRHVKQRLKRGNATQSLRCKTTVCTSDDQPGLPSHASTSTFPSEPISDCEPANSEVAKSLYAHEYCESLLANVRVALEASERVRSTFGIDSHTRLLEFRLWQGLHHWDGKAYAKACRYLSLAAGIVNDCLRERAVLAIWKATSGLARRCTSSGTLALYQQFNHFILESAREIFGLEHPLTRVTRALQDLAGRLEESLLVWQYLLDKVAQGDICAWWTLAKKRLKCSSLGSSVDQYEKHHGQTVNSLRECGELTPDRESWLCIELVSVYVNNGCTSKTHRTVAEAVDIWQLDPYKFWSARASVEFKLAILNRRANNLEAARQYFMMAFQVSNESGGYLHYQTLVCFKALMMFCQRHGYRQDVSRLAAQYPRMYSYYDDLTDGLWREVDREAETEWSFESMDCDIA